MQNFGKCSLIPPKPMCPSIYSSHTRSVTRDAKRATRDRILVIDKPAGPTSHDIVQEVKRIIAAKKVGHLGTLDPAATGVLPLAINGATKQANKLAGTEKIYEFTLKLGTGTDTDDDTGRVITESQVPPDAVARLEGIIPSFIGRIIQRPPNYSAVKTGGRRAYEWARKGIAPDIAPRFVQIVSLSIISLHGSDIRMRLECHSGTYVRSLCRDIGEALGCHGHAGQIRRLRSGPYTIAQAITMEALKDNPSMWSLCHIF